MRGLHEVLLLLSTVASSVGASMCGCESALPVLMDFYNATNGPMWTQSSGWGSSNCSVSWFGLTCSGNAITELNLSSNNLSGTLTESLVNLTALESLRIGSNRIHGTLPSSWRMLGQLQQLDVSRNILQGSILSSWVSTNLQNVDFSHNTFSGTLAETYGTGLVSIDFSYNQLVGTLPAGWASIFGISYVSVAHNNIEGTLPDLWKTMGAQSFFNGNGLRLILSYNRIGGSLPGNWSQLSTVSELHLDHNNLQGPLPDSWPAMSGGRLILVLDSNPLNATLPRSWKAMSNTAVISLANCSLYGTLPSNWQFESIEQLFLNDNALNGTMPHAWGNMGQTDVFSFANMSNNCLSGTVPWAYLSSGDPPPIMDTCGTRLDLATGNCTRLPTYWPAYCSPRLHMPTLTAGITRKSRSMTDSTTEHFSTTHSDTSLDIVPLHSPTLLSRSLSQARHSRTSTTLTPTVSISPVLIQTTVETVTTAVLAAAASAPLPATALISAFSGVDAGSAQALLTFLQSPCIIADDPRSPSDGG